MNHKGFTLIELIMVIVILGILAVVAIPKYIDMKAEAEKSVITAFVGALGSARTIAFSKMTVAGQGYTSPSALRFFGYVQFDSNETLNEADPAKDWDGNYIGLWSLRQQIFNDPNQQAYNYPDLSFTTKSGRIVTISDASGAITWSANPAY
jgi:prepilin-type N-terminal cleavage/methylation domain-containing protein